MEGRGLLRGAALLVFLALARVVISGSLQSPLVSDPAPDALPELLDRAEEARRLDSIRTLPLGEGERMDPNRSSVDELDRLPGVGPRVAAAIVQFRFLRRVIGPMDMLLRRSSLVSNSAFKSSNSLRRSVLVW